MTAIVIVLSILTLVLSVGEFSALLKFYTLAYVVGTSICLISVTWAVVARKSESSLALTGTLILSAATAFDYGVANYQIANFYVIPLASALFLIMLSQLVAKRSAEAYRNSEYLAEELLIKNREVTSLNQNLEGLVDKKTEEIRIQSASMKLILDSINEGIVKISHAGHIEAESSAWAFKFFDIKVGDPIRNFINSLDAPTDAKEATLAVIDSSLGEGTLQWELNSSIPLKSAFYNERTIALIWHPIIINDRVAGMVITAIDETERLAVERLTKESEEKSERLLRKARVLLKGNVKMMQAFVNDLPRLLEGLSGLYRQEGNSQTIMRNVHTIKGNARSFGMNEIRDIAHNLENSHRDGDSSSVRLLSHRLEEELKEYQSALRDVIGMQAYISSEHVIDIVYGMVDEIRSQLSSNNCVLGGVTIRDELGILPAEAKEILLHGLTNAVDHGFILPLKRGKIIRDAHVRVEGYRDKGKSILKIKDNGDGIDWDRIDELCKQMAFYAAPDRPKTDILFLDRVSTASEVSLTSGRGVGLSAVRAAVISMGGVVSLLDNEDGQGSMLVVEW
jgi:HPt (histidine-containing phosphotransfer) domain-containing protein